MEDLDRQILRLLAADGRMSYTDLGRATGPDHLGGPPARAQAGGAWRHPRLRRRRRPGGGRPAADRVRLGHPAGPGRAGRCAGQAGGLPAIEACYSVAGEESYILKVRVPPPGDLETLLAEIRAAANVRTRTIVVLSTPYEGRPPAM